MPTTITGLITTGQPAIVQKHKERIWIHLCEMDDGTTFTIRDMAPAIAANCNWSYRTACTYIKCTLHAILGETAPKPHPALRRTGMQHWEITTG